jgi:hypothetical protein
MLGLAFVFGMTFPLFVMALAWDRLRLREKSWLQARPVRLRLPGHTLVTNTVNITVAVGFAVMGGLVIYLAGAQTMTSGPGFQAAIGRWLSRQFEHALRWLQPIPEPVLGLLVLAIAAVFVWATLTDRRAHRPSPAVTPGPSDDHGQPACHQATTRRSVAARPGPDEETPR